MLAIKYHHYSLLLVLSIYSIMVSAQAFEPPVNIFYSMRNASCDIADIDLDGDEDIVITGNIGAGAFATDIYLNYGNATFAQNSNFEVLPAYLVEFVDFDNDGLEDLVLGEIEIKDPSSIPGPSYDATKIFKNEGAGIFEFQKLSIGENDRSIATADVNGDGYQDMCFNDDYYLVVHKNQTSFNFESNAIYYALRNGSLSFSDIDLDDDVDLFVTGHKRNFYDNGDIKTSLLFNNDGSGNFTINTQCYIEQLGKSSSVFADFNNDGYDDLLVTGENNSFESRTILYLNDTAGCFYESNDSNFLPVADGAVAATDIDLDNDIDIVLTGYNSFTNQSVSQFYLNDGYGIFTESVSLLPVKESTLNFSDLDNDGDQDLLLTGNNSIGTGQKNTVLYINTVSGCTDATACNFNPNAVIDDGNCKFSEDICNDGNAFTELDTYNNNCECTGNPILEGCMDVNACNYNQNSTIDDGSCNYFGGVCDDGNADTFNDKYNAACNCIGEIAVGCMESDACNFNPTASIAGFPCNEFGDYCSDGNPYTSPDLINSNCECQGELIEDCMDPNACNFNMYASFDDGSCYYVSDACDDNNTLTYDETIDEDCNCIGIAYIQGCTDTDACNFNVDAELDDNSCLYTGQSCNDGDNLTTNDLILDTCICEGVDIVEGCLILDACNYNPLANTDDNSCYFIGEGCDDGLSINGEDFYNEYCECIGSIFIPGCWNPNACNYDTEATYNDGSCLYISFPCDDNNELTENDIVQSNCVCIGTMVTNILEIENSNIDLYPNPFKNHINIKLKDHSYSQFSVKMYNSTGKMVNNFFYEEGKSESINIDTKNIPAGIYFILITTDENSFISKLIKN